MSRITYRQTNGITGGVAMPLAFVFRCVASDHEVLRLRLRSGDNSALSISVLDENLAVRVRSLRIGRIAALPSSARHQDRAWCFSAQLVRENFDEFMQSDLVVALDDRTLYRISMPFQTAVRD